MLKYASSETENVAERIMQITGGAGIKVAFDSLGGGPVASSVVDCLAVGGVSYVYGLLCFGQPWTYNMADLLFKGRTAMLVRFCFFFCFLRFFCAERAVKGFYLGQRLQAGIFPNVFAELGSLLEAMAHGSLSCDAQPFNMATQWQDAFKALATPGRTSKPVLVSK